jgi:hypothetical protein
LIFAEKIASKECRDCLTDASIWWSPRRHTISELGTEGIPTGRIENRICNGAANGQRKSGEFWNRAARCF